MNEIIGKTQLLRTSHLPQKSTVNKINLFDEAKILKRLQKAFFRHRNRTSQDPTAKTTVET